jgi:hypothetical protein
MTARFKEIIPVLDGHEVALVHLADFPKGDLLKSKVSDNGPIDFYSVPEGLKVLALDETRGTVSWHSVSNYSVHHDREVEIVNLESGRQIVTDNDPRAVYGIAKGTLRFGRFTPAEAVALKVFVPRSDRLTSIEQITCEPYASAEKGPHSWANRQLKSEIPLTADFGYFLGVMAGDGWISQERQICVASISDEIAERLNECIASFFTTDSPVSYCSESEASYGESRKHTWSNTQLARTVLPLIGKGCRGKHLPPFYLNAPLEFREGLFAGLMDTDGSISISNGKKNPQLMSNYNSTCLRLAQEAKLLAASLGIKGRITPGKTPAGLPAWTVNFSNQDIKNTWNGKHMVHQEKLRKLASIEEIQESAVTARYDIIPISQTLADHALKLIGAPRNASKQHKSLYAILHKARNVGSMSRSSAKKLFDFCSPEEFCKHPDAKMWLRICENTDIQWDAVVGYERSGIRETGFDLTVPGYETFMNADGVILSNTMTVHVPITEEANKEAERLKPSRNLFQPGSGKLMIQPSQEAQIGLFYLSQTPAGRATLNRYLPEKFHITATLDKKSTGSLVMRLSKELPAEQYALIVANLKAEGEKHAFERGFTLGLEDIAQFGETRDKIVESASRAAKGAKDQTALMSVNSRASGLIDKIIEKKLEGKGNPLFDMVRSGARGNSSQLRQIVATPLFMSDEKGRIIPTPIKKSYAEGLDVGDYWISMYGARRGMMDRAIQTSLPGAFSKDIMATTIGNVISKEDCGTHEGIIHKLEDSDVYDRFLAGDQGGFSHNTLVDARVIGDLKKRGLTTVKVRSPLRCIAPKGTCAKCYGIDEHGHTPEVGENIGAKAGQTMSEPLVQMVMRTFHTGGAAGTGADVQGYARIDQLLQMPKEVAGAAPLAPVAGKVTKIEKGLGGGWNVTIGKNSVVHVPMGKPLKVRTGDEVSRGDPISEGPIRPQDLVKHLGMNAAQDYLAGELKKSYQGQGVNLHRKIFETVVRAMGNTTQVQNAPKGTGYLPGDIIPYTVAQHHNQNLTEEVPISQSVGQKLAAAVSDLKKGHEMTEADVSRLQASVATVKIEKDPIVHAPLLKSVRNLPLLRKDWMAAMGYQQLQKAITTGASQGWSTDTSDYHPIPAFAYGAEFGKGKEGKY